MDPVAPSGLLARFGLLGDSLLPLIGRGFVVGGFVLCCCFAPPPIFDVGWGFVLGCSFDSPPRGGAAVRAGGLAVGMMLGGLDLGAPRGHRDARVVSSAADPRAFGFGFAMLVAGVLGHEGTSAA